MPSPETHSSKEPVDYDALTPIVRGAMGAEVFDEHVRNEADRLIIEAVGTNDIEPGETFRDGPFYKRLLEHTERSTVRTAAIALGLIGVASAAGIIYSKHRHKNQPDK